MTQNLRIIIIVLMRLASLLVLATQFLAAGAMVLLGSDGRLISFWPGFGVPLIVGFLLWVLAKPCADVVTHGLDEAP